MSEVRPLSAAELAVLKRQMARVDAAANDHRRELRHLAELGELLKNGDEDVRVNVQRGVLERVEQ